MRKKFHSILKLLLLSLALILGVIATRQLVSAASVDDVITSVELTNKDGGPLTDSLAVWERFQMDAKFAFDYGKVQPGDQTTIELPTEFILDGADFDLKDPEGNLVATAALDGGRKKIVLTYTDYVAQRAHITGNVHLLARVDHTVARDQTSLPLTLRVGNQIIDVGRINYQGVPIGNQPERQTFIKYGWDNPDDIRSITYNLNINQNHQELHNVQISDNLKFEGGQIDENSFEIVKGRWELGADDNSYQLVDLENVRWNYDIQVADDKQSFTVNMGNINAEDGYYIRYRVNFPVAPANFSVFPNLATLSADNVGTIQSVVNLRYQRATGDAVGDVYEVQVHKKDGLGNSLAGAEFTLYDGETEVAKAVSDENGIVSFKNLVKDRYTIRETKAPQGYRGSDEVLEVSASEREMTVNGVKQYAQVITKEMVNVQTAVVPPTSSSSSDSSSSSESSSTSSSSGTGSDTNQETGGSDQTGGGNNASNVKVTAAGKQVLPRTGEAASWAMLAAGAALVAFVGYLTFRPKKSK